MPAKSVVVEGDEIGIARELITLGARIQILQVETSLSRARLLGLYRELRDDPPPKGLLPFSADWFMRWGHNIHSTLFFNRYKRLLEQSGEHRLQALIKAYRSYQAHVESCDLDVLLGITRAWVLMRYFEKGLLRLTECNQCHGHFVDLTSNAPIDYVCGICKPPSRAGKTTSH